MTDDVKLPPLPAPDGSASVVVGLQTIGAMLANVTEEIDAWSESLVLAYAREAVMAERGRIRQVVAAQLHPTAEILYGHTREKAVEWAKEDKYDSCADKANAILEIVDAAICQSTDAKEQM